MGDFLRKQGLLILQKEKYAFLLTAVFCFIPMASWLSIAIMALVTLRNGAHAGFKVGVIGVTASLIDASLNQFFSQAVQEIVLIYILTFIAAWVLRTWSHLQQVIDGLLFCILSQIVIMHWIMPEQITKDLSVFLAVLSKINQGNHIAEILNKETLKDLIASYFFGIKNLVLLLSVVFPLMMARYIQSLIFYPEGFKKELLSFRANPLVVFVMTICILGAYQHYTLAVSALPTLISYVTAAGIILSFNVLHKKQGKLTLLIILIPLLVVPYIILPIYVVFGTLDSLFNFRNKRIRGG
jgi:hypothetical protein